MEPLKAPKRIAPSARESDNSALWWIVVLGLCLVAAIAYEHLGPGADTQDVAGLSETGVEGEGAGMAGIGMGTRKEMKEAPIEKAKALPAERFAAAVSHVQDSDACRSLRKEKDRVQQAMKTSHSSAEAKEYQLDLRSIRNRGTELGCWSGGAG